LKSCLAVVQIHAYGSQVLLESASSFGIEQKPKENKVVRSGHSSPRLLIFSAKHPEALRQNIANHESYLSSHPNSIQDMAYTLAKKRELLSRRAFCVTNGEDFWDVSRTHKPGGQVPPKLVFTFSGQGAQWAQMGLELIRNDVSFRNSIQSMDNFLAQLPEPPKWSLMSMTPFCDRFHPAVLLTIF
jgi:acyl transferase domain-containing protein